MNWANLIKKAKTCHSRRSWHDFWVLYGEKISTAKTSKPIEDLYRVLQADSHALSYGEDLWSGMLSACLSCWDLHLGIEIANFVEKIPSFKTRLKIAEIYLESGYPTNARTIAKKSKRLRKLKEAEKMSLNLIICKSHVEEGRLPSAKRMLSNLEKSIHSIDLPALKKAEILIGIARAKFFLGDYSGAADLFSGAFKIYRRHNNWEAAASSLFNSAACLDNSGIKFRQKSFALIAECEALSEKYQLNGPLSHCLAFKATHYQQKGEFCKAIDLYRKALESIPSSEKSFRKLHIVSMLAFTFLKAGQFTFADRYGNHTLKLAQKDKSERFKIRYTTLQAELDWQRGAISESYTNLSRSYKNLEANGVHTLEELSSLSRFNIKSAHMNVLTNPNIIIAKSLKNNNATWLEYRLSLAYQALVRHEYSEASSLSRHLLNVSHEYESLYFEAQSLCLLMMIRIGQQSYCADFFKWMRRLEEISQARDLKAFRVNLYIIKASLSYTYGDFDQVQKHLQDAFKLTGLPMQKQVILRAWWRSINQKSLNLSNSWKASLIATGTKIYFAPSLKKIGDHDYLVSGCYKVSLKNYPILNQLLHYLMIQKNYIASPESIQQDVWRQPTTLQSWQQKIRNSVTRLRSLFPHALLPIIIIENNQVRLFSEAIKIIPPPMIGSNSDQVIAIIQKSPQSSAQISHKINISPATTKRILRQLLSQGKIIQSKHGRKIIYAAAIPQRHSQPSSLLGPHNADPSYS